MIISDKDLSMENEAQRRLHEAYKLLPVCPMCGMRCESVRERPDGYSIDIHNDLNDVYTACDDCDDVNDRCIWVRFDTE